MAPWGHFLLEHRHHSGSGTEPQDPFEPSPHPALLPRPDALLGDGPAQGCHAQCGVHTDVWWLPVDPPTSPLRSEPPRVLMVLRFGFGAGHGRKWDEGEGLALPATRVASVLTFAPTQVCGLTHIAAPVVEQQRVDVAGAGLVFFRAAKPCRSITTQTPPLLASRIPLLESNERSIVHF